MRVTIFWTGDFNASFIHSTDKENFIVGHTFNIMFIFLLQSLFFKYFEWPFYFLNIFSIQRNHLLTALMANTKYWFPFGNINTILPLSIEEVHINLETSLLFSIKYYPIFYCGL